MKPIAQTFLIPQPTSGAEGIFLSKIDLFFKTVSSTYGVTVQIRTVENGFPTSNMLGTGIARVAAGVALSSDDSSISTSFVFSSPPFLQINTQYAITVIPDGGTDEYEVWTGVIGGVDALTNSPIYTNNALGNLFISSNDLVFTPITTESMKYDLYIATMTANSGTAVYNFNDLEFMNVNGVVGSFMPDEQVFISNTTYTGATTNAASNTVIVSNSAVAELSNNSLVFITTPDRSSMTITRVVSAPNSSTIVVSPRPAFSNTGAMYGGIRSSGALRMHMGKSSRVSQFEDVRMEFYTSTANSTVNFSNSSGCFIIGATSTASAVVISLEDRPYDSLTIGINSIAPKETGLFVSYEGVANDAPRTADGAYTTGQIGIPNEFTDIERVLMSRSNEYNLAGGRAGSYSSAIKVDLSTANTLTSPYVDDFGSVLTYTYSPPVQESMLTGTYLDTVNTNGSFVNGEIVTQGSASGIIDFANSSYIRVTQVTGSFTANSTVAVGGTSSANSLINAATNYDESLRNGYYAASRYISKSVVLGDKQDAEDLICFLTAYRPVGANFKVYAKFLAGADTDTFDNKAWSVLTENTISVALFSSPVLRDDSVELQFGVPQSLVVDTSGATVSNSANTVTVGDTTSYTVGGFVYIVDPAGANFNVRKVTAVVNNSTLQLSSIPSFSEANATVGVVPDLQTQTGAFVYTANFGVLRYTTTNDAYFDTYKTFAIKIVPISNNSIRVPIMQDMRCIALQV